MSPLPILRAGFEGSGSPRWLMRTMQTAGFDRANGFTLDLVLLSEGAHRHGTLQALADGRVDLVDADRQALAAAQADGLPVIAAHPYGRILGSVLVQRDYRGKPAQSGHRLAALRGRRFGVLSVHDKNWTLLAAACAELAAFDLPTAVTPVLYRCRADLVAALDAGEVDAALVHWHLVPQLTSAGHRVLAELPALADALGAAHAAYGSDQAPTTYFVVHEQLAATRPALLASFIAATGQAVERLREDAGAWDVLAEEGAIVGADRSLLPALRTRWQDRVGRYFSDRISSEFTEFTPRSTPCNPF